MSKIYKITHKGQLKLGDVVIPCYVTEDGVRVLSGRRMQDVLKVVEEKDNNVQKPGARFKRFLGRKFLKQLITKEIMEDLFSPLICEYKGKKISGYKADALAKFCETMIEANRLGLVTTDRQKIIAAQADILQRAFSAVGIVALVDEATGYQKVRPGNELSTILDAYIAKELLPWKQRFPDNFYQEIFRLNNWRYDPNSVKRPKVVGRMTEDIIYRVMPDGVLEELKEKNPKTSKGYRKHKHHQLLTDNIGVPHLEKQIASVTTLMRISANWRKFKSLLNRAFPKKGDISDLFPDDLDE